MWLKAIVTVALFTIVTATPAAAAPANGRLVYELSAGAIASVAPDGSAATVIRSGHRPSVSPDGARIAFVDASARDPGTAAIWVVGVDGSNPTELAPTSGSSSPAWSPDGSRVAFVSGTGAAGWSILVVRTDGSGSPVTAADDASPGTPPSWSPNGALLAYTTRDGVDVALAHADGSGTFRLIRDTARDIAPAWSPDGGRIAFFREVMYRFVLYVMNPDGSGLVQLGNARAPDVYEDVPAAPAWSPDGSRIAFGTSEIAGSARSTLYFDRNVYSVRADGSDERQLTDTRSLDGGRAPFWSPDGRRLAFVSARGGTAQVFQMNADGSCETEVTAGDPASNASWQSLASGQASERLECSAISVVGSIDSDRTRPYLDDDRIYIYRGTITNGGTRRSGSIALHLQGDGPMLFVGASSPGATCVVAAAVDCNVPPLDAGAATNVEIRFRVLLRGWHSLAARVEHSGPYPDGDPSDDVDRPSRYFPFCDVATTHGSTLRASSDPDLICGTLGADRIWSGDGEDRVLAGRGHDVVRGQGGRDWLFGGDGSDYLYGGGGDDRLHGEEADDVLFGGPGGDLLWGDYGGDYLVGGPGSDHVYAGYGSDSIDVRDGVLDHVYCGEGRDRVRADLRDVVSNCEQVERAPARP